MGRRDDQSQEISSAWFVLSVSRSRHHDLYLSAIFC